MDLWSLRLYHTNLAIAIQSNFSLVCQLLTVLVFPQYQSHSIYKVEQELKELKEKEENHY